MLFLFFSPPELSLTTLASLAEQNAQALLPMLMSTSACLPHQVPR